MKVGMTLDGLDTLFGQPIAAEILSEALIREVQESIQGLGDYYEGMSALSGLLSVTTVIDRLNPFQLREERYSCFTGLRNFPDCSTVDAINCLVSVWESECVGVGVCVWSLGECHGCNLKQQ